MIPESLFLKIMSLIIGLYRKCDVWINYVFPTHLLATDIQAFYFVLSMTLKFLLYSAIDFKFKVSLGYYIFVQIPVVSRTEYVFISL